jgi:hypothetical protein
MSPFFPRPPSPGTCLHHRVPERHQDRHGGTTRTVSQFGSDLVGYLGRSSYPDNFYKGGIRDVSVYTEALTDADVATLFATGSSTTDDEAVQQDAAAITIPNVDDVRGNLTLPTAGATGTKGQVLRALLPRREHHRRRLHQRTPGLHGRQGSAGQACRHSVRRRGRSGGPAQVDHQEQ